MLMLELLGDLRMEIVHLQDLLRQYFASVGNRFISQDVSRSIVLMNADTDLQEGGLVMIRTDRIGLNQGPPRGIWVVCILKSTGQPYAGIVVLSEDDIVTNEKWAVVNIPSMNIEINSKTYNWEILI